MKRNLQLQSLASSTLTGINLMTSIFGRHNQPSVDNCMQFFLDSNFQQPGIGGSAEESMALALTMIICFRHDCAAWFKHVIALAET